MTDHKMRWSVPRPLPLLECFQLLQGARPVLAEQPRERPVRQKPAAGLARRTIVGFVAGVTDALDPAAAPGAGLAVLSMGGHLRAERRHLFRELALRLGAQPVHPLREDLASGRVEARRLVPGQLERHGDRTEAGAMQDLVGGSVADSAEKAWIGEGAVPRVGF